MLEQIGQVAKSKVGIVKWKGKNDIQGTLASWNKLLATNPNYPERQRVVELIDQLKSGGA